MVYMYKIEYFGYFTNRSDSWNTKIKYKTTLDRIYNDRY